MAGIEAASQLFRASALAMVEPITPFMAVVIALSAGIIIAKFLYVGTAILQRKEDPSFEGSKVTI